MQARVPHPSTQPSARSAFHRTGSTESERGALTDFSRISLTEAIKNPEFFTSTICTRGTDIENEAFAAPLSIKWTTIRNSELNFQAQFRNNVCATSLTTFICIFTDGPEIIVPNCEMRSKIVVSQTRERDCKISNRKSYLFYTGQFPRDFYMKTSPIFFFFYYTQ